MMFFLLLFSFILLLSARWSLNYFGLSCFEQIIFHTKVPLEGANTQFIIDWCKQCFIPALLITVGIDLFLYFTSLSSGRLLISMIVLLIAAYKVGLITFTINLFRTSNLIEKEYVDPATCTFTFPKQKRNLIYIYVESLETTFADKKDGGNYSGDLLYPLTKLTKEHTHFSNTSHLGGANVLSGNGWTTGGIVGQSAGIPLFVSLGHKKFKGTNPFYPGAHGIGDILEKEGYNQEYLIGSDALFGGREFYFKKHGNFNIFDLKYAHEYSKIPKDYNVFWGFEDTKLFAFAKEELTRLAAQSKPFHFVTLTVDPHHPYGYVCNACETKYKEQLSNVIHCNATQVYEFVTWIQEQPFYENTTIVVTGDHLSMAANYINKTYDSNYERRVFNTIINAPIQAENNINRNFSTLDMFPTTLAAMGIKISGNRLGLGVNLYSGEKTLLEKYSYTYVDREFRKQSTLYKNKILSES